MQQLNRRRGRPNNDWATCLYRKVSVCLTTHIEFMDCVNGVNAWHDFATQFIENED